MGKTDCYCIICGAKLKSGFVCSGTCFNIYKESKSKLINGFCNLCGLPLLLKIGSKGEIWNNHIRCNLSILTRNFIEKATKVRAKDQQERKNLKKEFLELENLKKKLKNNSIEKEFSKIDILESEVKEKYLENQHPERKRLERERL